MTGPQFASTYLDPPSGLLFVLAGPGSATTGPGWPSNDFHFHRGWAADALRRARRNSGMGMTDPQAVAAIPAWLIKRLTQASLVKDSQRLADRAQHPHRLPGHDLARHRALLMTAAAFMAGCASRDDQGLAAHATACPPARSTTAASTGGRELGGRPDRLQAVPQYLKALTDSGQLANFQALTPG